jgi:hypothetical protein
MLESDARHLPIAAGIVGKIMVEGKSGSSQSIEQHKGRRHWLFELWDDRVTND